MTTRNMTCIVCPMGCQLVVELEDGVVKTVSGNTCPRGKQYAVDECTHPMRTITSTARTDNGEVIPVKTDRTVPKEMMFDCMKEINRAVVKLPAKIGDVVVGALIKRSARSLRARR